MSVVPIQRNLMYSAVPPVGLADAGFAGFMFQHSQLIIVRWDTLASL